MSDQLTFHESIYLLQAAFIRAGSLMELDQIIDEQDPVKRVMIVATTISQNGRVDGVISGIVQRVNLLGILKKEAITRNAAKLMKVES